MKQYDFKYEAVTGRDAFKGFLNLPYERQLIEYFDKGVSPFERIIRYESTDTHVSLEHILNEIEFTGTGFYTKTTTYRVFSYDWETKRIISNYDKYYLLEDLMELQPFEWLKKGRENHQVHSKMFTEEVVADILVGEITDIKTIFDRYFTEVEVWSIDWKLYNEYLEMEYYPLPISWIYVATTNANKALKVLIEGNVKHFERMIMMALSIGEKIDPTWTEERMEEEYNNLKRKVDYDEAEAETINSRRFSWCADLPI